jgi:hypothetical protein
MHGVWLEHWLVEWLNGCLLLITTMLSLLAPSLSPPTRGMWKCMVPTRGHRDGPPRRAICYASVRRGGTKGPPSLNASQNIPHGFRFVILFLGVML